jgi:hypothetical protein
MNQDFPQAPLSLGAGRIDSNLDGVASEPTTAGGAVVVACDEAR